MNLSDSSNHPPWDSFFLSSFFSLTSFLQLTDGPWATLVLTHPDGHTRARSQRLPACFLFSQGEHSASCLICTSAISEHTLGFHLFTHHSFSLKLLQDFYLFDAFLFCYQSTAFWFFTLNSNRLGLVLSHPGGTLLTRRSPPSFWHSCLLVPSLGLKSSTSRCCLQAE